MYDDVEYAPDPVTVDQKEHLVFIRLLRHTFLKRFLVKLLARIKKKHATPKP